MGRAALHVPLQCRSSRFRSLGTILLISALVGCGAPAPAPESPPVEHTSELGVPGAIVPRVHPGEWVRGKVYILGIEAASAEAWACRDDEEELHVHLRAESTGLLALLKRASMEQDTELTPKHLFPGRNWADAEIGTKQRRYDVRFGQGAYRYTYRRNYGPTREDVIRLSTNERAHDLLSAVLALRAWRPSPGTQGRLGAVLGRWLWQTDVVYLGPDVILREDGPYPAVKIQGTTKKQHPDPEQCEEYEFELWFSDDSSRMPLRAVSGSTFGNLALELTEYESNRVPRCLEHRRILEDPPASEVD